MERCPRAARQRRTVSQQRDVSRALGVLRQHALSRGIHKQVEHHVSHSHVAMNGQRADVVEFEPAGLVRASQKVVTSDQLARKNGRVVGPLGDEAQFIRLRESQHDHRHLAEPSVVLIRDAYDDWSPRPLRHRHEHALNVDEANPLPSAVVLPLNIVVALVRRRHSIGVAKMQLEPCPRLDRVVLSHQPDQVLRPRGAALNWQLPPLHPRPHQSRRCRLPKLRQALRAACAAVEGPAQKAAQPPTGKAVATDSNNDICRDSESATTLYSRGTQPPTSSNWCSCCRSPSSRIMPRAR